MSRFRGAYASFLLAPVLSVQLHARPRLNSPSLSLHPTPGHPRRCAQLPTHGPEQPDRQSYGTTNRQLRPHYLCHPDRSRAICPWISCCHCSGCSGHHFHQPPRATRNSDVAILDSFTPRWPCQECLTKIARKLSLATRLFFSTRGTCPIHRRSTSPRISTDSSGSASSRLPCALTAATPPSSTGLSSRRAVKRMQASLAIYRLPSAAVGTQLPSTIHHLS